MYEIEFYEDQNGYREVAYLDILSDMGTRVGEPVTKHLEGEIWELRPLKHRFLYAYYKNRRFLILHHFIKKTRKTPRKEMERALKKLEDYKERNE